MSVSLDVARQAIAAESGDVNAAAANFLLGIFPVGYGHNQETPLGLLARPSSSKLTPNFSLSNTI